MLTIFAVPKPFVGHDAVTQRNAIGTWVRLRPSCRIVLCGQDEGVAEAASEFEADYIPSVAVNEFGTPLLSSVFSEVEQGSSDPFLCYVNADILVLAGFADAVERVAAAMDRFLMVGQRWDLDVTEALPLDDPNWDANLRARTRSAGVVHPPSGSDYFVFPRGSVGPLPDFAVGRGGWDNWMIAHALGSGVPVVDATESAFVVHQNHGYDHVKEQSGHAWEGTETSRNRDLIEGEGSRLLTDATHRLTDTGIRRASRFKAMNRRWKSR